MTDHLRTLLETQYAAHLRLKKAGTICPHVFFREVAKGRGEGSGRTMDSALLVVGLFVANSDRVQDNSLISKARRNGGEASSCGTCSWH